jgi:hypothetical protein
MMRHYSAGGTGGWDVNGSKPGDSGGPCYYANQYYTGENVLGIVQGGDYQIDGKMYYFCTLLKGLRAWKSSANTVAAS